MNKIDTTKLLSDDVHSSKNGLLVVIIVSNVPEVECAHKNHGKRNLENIKSSPHNCEPTSPKSWYCLAAMLKFNNTHKMRPGRASQNNFKSKLKVVKFTHTAQANIRSNSRVAGKSHPIIIREPSAHALLLILQACLNHQQESEHK